ncbi:MAG: alanine racemase [Phototrophicaceae bacterium]
MQSHLNFESFRPSWIEISEDALLNNLQQIRKATQPHITIMPAVKADAYGHGAIRVARLLVQNGIEHLAVANIAEAFELRQHGIDSEILVMGYLPPHAVLTALAHNITATLYSLDQLEMLQATLTGTGQRLRVHLKLDTGMGRLGFLTETLLEWLPILCADTHLQIEGIYTHFSVADEDPHHTNQQVEAFKRALLVLEETGFHFHHVHASNSAGTLLGQDYHFNMVRPGILTYGYNPSSLVTDIALQPILTWKTTVTQVKTVPINYPVGYGNTYRTPQSERIALIPVGYADGIRRAPSRWKCVLVEGKRAPLIGRVSMEKTVIRVEDIPDVRIGSEVVLIGKQGAEQLTADEIATWFDTIAYDILTNALPRVPRPTA